jgi:restriction system protein
MSRSRGFVSTLIRIEKNARRAQAAQARAAIRASRAAERFRLAEAKEQKRNYIESRLAEAEDQNADLQQTIDSLESILSDGISRECSLDLDTLKEPLRTPPFEPGDLARAAPIPELSQYLPPSPMWLMRLLPGTKEKHERQSADARQRFEADMIAHAESETRRRGRLELARAAHELRVQEVTNGIKAQHAEVDELKRGVQARAAEAVAAFFTLVLARSEYPDDFSSSSEVTYEPASKVLAVDMELPGFDIVPEAGSFKYIKAKDEIVASSRSAKERRSLYASVIARSALRTLHEVFSADKVWQAVDTVAFNGYVCGIDPATGKLARPRVVSVIASPDVFLGFDLRRVDPAACLHALHAAISKKPDELIPVEAIFGFNVADRSSKRKEKQ